MNRYSTITLEIEFEIDLNSVDDIWLTFQQGINTITKKKSLEEITVAGNICTVTLSQKETASFEAYTPIALQARWLTYQGETDSSSIEYIHLGDVLKEGEM